uniref:Uncharacterized protein n=1 Tax=Cacopsylla melanoneura TaxID=428564 RepID=A0A8D8UEH3_9HEMI
MSTRVISIQLLAPSTVVLYLIITQCKLSTGIEDSQFTEWTNVDMKNDTWPGIKNLIGKDPCAEKMKYCYELATIIKKMKEVTALRKDCESDYTVTYPNQTLRTICWIRLKETFDLSKKTTFEVQFWSESPTVSQMRFATPP